jgi:hypothetical protein
MNTSAGIKDTPNFFYRAMTDSFQNMGSLHKCSCRFKQRTVGARLFLEKEVDVVNAQRRNLLIGTLQIEQQATERNENSP